MTAEDIQEDLVRMDHGDPELAFTLEKLRQKTLAKGLVHSEVLKSKTYGTIKYLLKNWPNGAIIITDLDTGEEYGYVDPPDEVLEAERRSRERIRDWIKSKAA